MRNPDRIENVLISGGTHGNEYTGAYLIRHWLKDPEILQRRSFQTHPLFANPRAFTLCRRYVDRDLNRSFHPSAESDNPHAFELGRAVEIENELRQRCGGHLPEVIFDLHSTTAHMGMSLVLTNKDPFNIQLYAFLRSQFTDVRAYLWEEPTSRPGFLNSLSRYGFAIEVGAVANGALNAEWVFKTADLVAACLNFIEMWNNHDDIEVPAEIPLYCFEKHIDYPRSEDGLPAAMVHPRLQGQDFQLIKKGDPVFMDFSGRTIFWNEEPVWPVFINEAAYYEKGIAFTATRKIEISTR